MNQKIIFKIKNSLIKNGFLITTYKIFSYPISLIKYQIFKKEILSLKSNEDKFTWIYKKNYWSNPESLSGSGSTLDYTKNLRHELPVLFNKFSINKIFDAPCGDFNWMSHFLKSSHVDYIGGDIVKPLIENLNSVYRTSRIRFIHFDLIKEIPPEVDLIICRDCLFHFSFHDTRSVLQNFLKSNSNYLLTTTHTNINKTFFNRDITTGDFRYIDLFSTPYNFPTDPLFVIEDWMAPEPERQMCLWNKQQILSALQAFQI